MQILHEISSLIECGDFIKAKSYTLGEISKIVSLKEKENFEYTMLFNLAGFLIDIGSFSGDKALITNGLQLMEDNETDMLAVISENNYYYNLANAKSSLISFDNIFDVTFKTIEELVEVKALYFKSLKKSSTDEQKFDLYVNLANTLKRQFRVTESIHYYDLVISENIDIPQALVNRSESLLLLNTISETYTIKMIYDVINGYVKASESEKVLPSWSDHYKSIANDIETKFKKDGHILSDDDDEETRKEYDMLSAYRRFFLNHHLTLCEHGIYCSCVGSIKDNLTIPLTTKSIGGEFVPKMELALNRIKSEFSLARHLYYEYISDEKNHNGEDCFTELLNSEILGLRIEKLRSSFRLCFGILDKIALAICELFELEETKKDIYFHNFWRLDINNRREKFELIKNPGLLALYSIATDLNEHKNGEWSMFKQYRNALEHGFLVISDNSELDVYDSFIMREKVEIVSKDDFESFVKHLLQLTRSAIFSFVFCVRSEALKVKLPENGISISFHEKKIYNYS